MSDPLEIHESGYMGWHFTVRWEGTYNVLGGYEVLDDGTFLGFGRRKSVATQAEVVLQLLATEERHLRKQADRIARKRQSIINGEPL